MLSWRVSILKDHGMFQTKCIRCIKRQSQSQLIVRSAVITSVMSVLLCREMRGELFLSGARHDTVWRPKRSQIIFQTRAKGVQFALNIKAALVDLEKKKKVELFHFSSKSQK